MKNIQASSEMKKRQHFHRGTKKSNAEKVFSTKIENVVKNENPDNLVLANSGEQLTMVEKPLVEKKDKIERTKKIKVHSKKSKTSGKKRGRTLGSKNKKTLEKLSAQPAQVIKSEEKKKRGRTLGSKNKKTLEKLKAQSIQTVVSDIPKKKRGRTLGSKNKKTLEKLAVQSTPQIIKSEEKKKRGRKVGSKNKKSSITTSIQPIASVKNVVRKSKNAAILNPKSPNFDIKNFIERKCEKGDRNFIKLKAFMENHSYLDLDSAMVIINSNVANKAKKGKNTLTTDNFKITNLTKINNYSRIIGKIGKHFHDYQDKRLIKAIVSLWKIEGYNPNVMMSKLTHQKDKLKKCNTMKEYRNLLLSIYNYHSKRKLIA